jgi:hypothetical protein
MAQLVVGVAPVADDRMCRGLRKRQAVRRSCILNGKVLRGARVSVKGEGRL